MFNTYQLQKNNNLLTFYYITTQYKNTMKTIQLPPQLTPTQPSLSTTNHLSNHHHHHLTKTKTILLLTLLTLSTIPSIIQANTITTSNEIKSSFHKQRSCKFQCLVVLKQQGQTAIDACNKGCDQCTTAQLSHVQNPWTCFQQCKQDVFSHTSNPPDQFCEMGCIFNLCQGVCIGSTCVQKSGYGRGNVARDGGGSENDCCQAASALCYPGASSAPGQSTRLQRARQQCSGISAVISYSPLNVIEITAQSSSDDICTAYEAVQHKNPPECS
jgi:hypothetical protein